MHTRPIAKHLFTEESPVRLLGGRHRESGRIIFPYPHGSEAALYEHIALGRDGTLWAWTVQRFRPKSPPYAGPAAFEPFALGYVELPGETIVMARLTGLDFADITVGLPLRLTTIPFTEDADGTIVLTYAFGPRA